MKTKADELAEMIMTPEAWGAGFIGDEIIYAEDLAKLSKAIEAAIDERIRQTKILGVSTAAEIEKLRKRIEVLEADQRKDKI